MHMPLFPRYRGLSLARRWVGDLTYFGLKSQIAGGSVGFHLKPVAAARRSRESRVLWAAIFVKAIAIVARRYPILRQCYIPYPWPHIYEHTEPVVAAVIEREWNGEDAVFFGQVRRPDRQPLAELDAKVRSLKSQPVETVAGYRRLIRIARFPQFVRRLIWHLLLYYSGRVRSQALGTVSVNSIPGRDVLVTQAPSPLTLSLYFGPLEPNGEMKIHFFFDHRVVNGMEIYRLLRSLEATLNGEIADELRQMADSA